MKNYAAILFDLDGTLRLIRPNGIEAYIIFLAEHGVSVAPEQARLGERWAHTYWADTLRVKNDQARYADENFWLNYTREQIEALCVSDPDGCLATSVHEAFETRYAPEVYLAPSAHHVLGTLCSRGYTLGLVSNRADELSPMVTELSLEGYFAFTLASGEIDCWKPDPRIFVHACQLGQCDPRKSVYVGDNYYTDVVGAQAAGLTPVLYDPNDVFSDMTCLRIANLDELLARFA